MAVPKKLIEKLKEKNELILKADLGRALIDSPMLSEEDRETKRDWRQNYLRAAKLEEKIASSMAKFENWKYPALISAASCYALGGDYSNALRVYKSIPEEYISQDTKRFFKGVVKKRAKQSQKGVRE